MKPSKRKPKGVTFWGGVVMKLKKLATAIEMTKGPEMNIDDHDYRWVDDRINYIQSEGRKLTKDEMRVANNLWINMDSVWWWLVLLITIICGLAIPSLLQILWEEFKKNKEERDE